jgi:septum formation topological specificity factor MinE
MEVKPICSSTQGAGIMTADNRIPDIPQDVIESLARTILPSIRKYFESEEGQKEFAEWKAMKSKISEKVKLNKREGR